MKNVLSTPWLFLVVALCGCTGGSSIGSRNSGAPPIGPSPQLLDVSGSWLFTMNSGVPGMPSPTIAGNIAQSGTSLTGAMHVQGSNCFDPTVSNTLNGTVTSSNVALTLTSLDGQVITLTGNVAANFFTGTYAITGGCADGDRGTVAAMQVPAMTGNLSGTLTTSSGSGSMDFQLTQTSANPDGSFRVTGSGSFAGACFRSGTLVPGSFPTGSSILGTSLVLEIQTDNGTLNFTGTLDLSGQVVGKYAVAGGSCDQTGTAKLFFSPWNY